MFLLPSEPLNIKKVDPDFEKEYNALKKMDFEVYLFDHDQFVSYKQLVSNIDFSKSGEIVLRSWMLKESQYIDLYTILKRNGLLLINTPEQYVNCHHYPSVYKHIQNYASKSIWFHDITPFNVETCRDFLGGDLIIKDFVKSEKNDTDLFLLKKELSNSEFFERVLKFKESRGRLFNEGIVLKQYCDLRKYGNFTNEWRIFVFEGNIISCTNNSHLTYGQVPDIEFLNGIIPNIQSNFYTIDIAEKEDGTWMILECGDGQVSGLAPDMSEFIFYSKFLNKFDNSPQNLDK